AQRHRPVVQSGAARAAAPASISLISERLVLRAYRLGDAPAVWQAIDESRTSLERWVPDIGCRRTPEDVRSGLTSLGASPGERQVFAVCDRLSGRILGEVGLYEIDRQSGLGEVGYWLR